MKSLRSAFDASKKELVNEMLMMGSRVTKAVDKSIKSLLEQDTDLADEVIKEDDIIDGQYSDIEEKTITLMARQLPVAGDLRLLVSILIVTLHLERIGDLASNIAARAKSIIDKGGYHQQEEVVDIMQEMHYKCIDLLDKSLRAFAERDKKTGKDLHRLDDSIDDLNKKMIRKIAEFKDQENFEWLLDVTLISRWLERIADQAVDIGDLTRFMVSGKIRHL